MLRQVDNILRQFLRSLPATLARYSVADTRVQEEVVQTPSSFHMTGLVVDEGNVRKRSKFGSGVAGR